MQLYFMPFPQSIRPRWLLEEMNFSYELVKVSIEDLQKEEYKKIHPLAQTPVFINEGIKIFESSAICTYLGDRYIEKGFAPSFDSPARDLYYRWLFFGASVLDPLLQEYMLLTVPDYPHTFLPIANKDKLDKEQIIQEFKKASQPLVKELVNKDFLIEDRFTVADLIVGDILWWALNLNLLKQSPLITKYVRNIANRPARLRASSK